MLDVFRGLKNLIKVNYVHIDSPVFRLHYSITVILLISFSLIVTTRQYVGNPIDCIHTKDIPEDVLNTYCWIHSTYTLRSFFNKKVGVEVPYPGIGNSRSAKGKEDMSDRKIYKYYQWVCFCLFFQAMLFYAPRWLWKSWEGGKIRALMMDLDVGVCTEIEKKTKKKLILDYLWENLRYHNWWAYRYYLCEGLALVNVIGQMFLMNRFFDGEFMSFGLDVIRYMESDQEDRIDPMIYIFPRMVKCTLFNKFGSSGEVERHDALCILPLNVVNEKIYVFLWFWFVILGILTFITLVYRFIIIFSPRMRVYMMRMRFRLVRRDNVDTIVRRSKMGDWYLLYILGENIDSVIFRDIMHEFANKLNHNYQHHIHGVPDA
ncbi:innexin shaking-B isoform X2 [Spodoptera frugiperda]|uniref:Innexin n=2 Tax=Spodoptera frugiperda TaxID=7108 RepID=A0A9R0CUG0_SPOFR|nr:innexin shaking-B isoform X2 [Spodoptera frugiperda]XP_035429747.1 innexin shaking-B isoform X2 [Spodoptera frugiperda]XP_035429749.1 innexin shaking-B isoform X2 [Spodoptera frugiperda]XP_035429750.1 innexin shaking-B isoform X2 [Spodoptera frugiperda]XP_035429751.1 innexin shaking-B isoform X2 [Spodoptera frugiperda]XP_035429753.1 innexin shaking-B isoform X2 [Spodoptera frugiperda]XP_035429755.1 innexin shaking-B isoform X2 [Spodoptera frugiperda]XP_035429756.1 innexin shaking-B isofor